MGNKEEIKEIQIIGIDLGRGYTKAYTEFNGKKRECLFKSVVALGRKMDFENYKNPIYLELDEEDFFVGDLAEVEGDNPTQNSKDDKTTLTAKKLLFTTLNKLALTDNVKIMLGVPNKLYRKSVMQEIIECYKGKTVVIKDKIENTTKTVSIADISIYRESDASLMWTIRNNVILDKPIGMITVGFRTTELSYFDKGLKFNDKLSKTIETGNKTALEFVQRRLKEKDIIKKLNEIDSNKDDYDNLKNIAYRNLAESTIQTMEENWINQKEMKIFVGGGTALHMNFKDYKIIQEPQMSTAKGLWLVGTRVFK